MIFTAGAIWYLESGVPSGACDEIPTAADTPTLDELLALDQAPLNPAERKPGQISIQLSATTAVSAAAA